MVIWPGPKNSGEGILAEGVATAMPDATPIRMQNAAMLKLPFSRIRPMLKNRICVTILERKLVIRMASATKTTRMNQAE